MDTVVVIVSDIPIDHEPSNPQTNDSTQGATHIEQHAHRHSQWTKQLFIKKLRTYCISYDATLNKSGSRGVQFAQHARIAFGWTAQAI